MENAFLQFEIAPFLQKGLEKMNIITPTQIQSEAIPQILAGNHVVGRSKTGSGKTLAYLLPLLTNMDETNKELQGIVLAPTHELAMQIFRVMEELTADTSFNIDVFIGSANIKRQLDKLKKQKPQIIVGTPGRILELAQQKKLKIHLCKMVVVDEADRMLQERETRQSFVEISKRMDKETKYMFFSATIPGNLLEDIEALIRAKVTLVSSDAKLETEKVEHAFLKCEDRERIDVARRLVHSLNVKRGIIFVNHLDKVAETTEKFQYKGMKVAALSSDSDKHQRAKVLQQLQSGEIEIVVASDVAARGLDVDDVTHIINIHPPVNEDAYVHRAGRTGRMGKAGVVITLVTHKEFFIIDKFQKKLRIKMNEKELAFGKLTDKKS
ncbi:DEAD/DEAH box helicase [Anaerobacillus isosaccharinicus]|uniref:DEAD/DEAH box helicase n=1 Tax=Anaerobacillus isosaccharinicus TaxID=1532552 RepID=A0A1S2LKI3_9BACI|nr:DEAD/DEAH box helicase [Anaerobacillus isosaccharinicus]MBA5588378.1 DEAD/DEAH box helicase [Anaerobacillus isosaccharinicus]QOY38190.1 DEAD/DEAH box helicase [Anaerobacillus isosaccharinicus]